MGRLNKALERIRTERENTQRSRAITAAMTGEYPQSNSEARPAFFDNARSVKFNDDVLRTKRIINDDMDPSVRTSYKMLRTRLLQRMNANGWQQIAVTSATQGDGKTVTAINLAISLAGDVNHEVCLVDLDLRRSSIAEYLGVKIDQGVSDCLARGIAIEDVLLKTPYERLTLLPNLRAETHSSELLNSPEMRSLASQLAIGKQRIVVYDMPPILAADDMLAFESMVDTTLFVVAEGKTSRTEVVKACELLEGTNLIGTVLNRSDEKTASYY
jgi:protein-tyrosine kinase